MNMILLNKTIIFFINLSVRTSLCIPRLISQAQKLTIMQIFNGLKVCKTQTGDLLHSFKTQPGPRPGFRVLTRSPSRPGYFF